MILKNTIKSCLQSPLEFVCVLAFKRYYFIQKSSIYSTFKKRYGYQLSMILNKSVQTDIKNIYNI